MVMTSGKPETPRRCCTDIRFTDICCGLFC
jgi:hypothetical protein